MEQTENELSLPQELHSQQQMGYLKIAALIQTAPPGHQLYVQPAMQLRTYPQRSPLQNTLTPNHKHYRPPSLEIEHHERVTAQEVATPTMIDIDWNIPTTIVNERQKTSSTREK